MTFTDFFTINCPSCKLQSSNFWDTLYMEHLLCINSCLAYCAVPSWREKIVLKHGKIRRVKFSRLDCSHFTNTEASSQRERPNFSNFKSLNSNYITRRTNQGKNMSLTQGALLTICQGGTVEDPNLQVICFSAIWRDFLLSRKIKKKI